MRLILVLSSLTTFVSAFTFPTHLNLTTVAAANDVSIIECWQLTAPFVSIAGPTGPDIAQLGDIGAATYLIGPPASIDVFPNPLSVQYVVCLTGFVHLSLPTSSVSATINCGKNGLFLLTDTKNVSSQGHYASFSSSKETLGILIPTRYNAIPPHTVLHSGGCHKSEMF